MSEEHPVTANEPAENIETQKSGAKGGLSHKMPSLFRNYISYAGAAISVASLMCIGFLFLLELTNGHEQPYLGIFTFIVFPAILIFGLCLIFGGMILERRRRRHRAPTAIRPFPVLDLNNTRQRRTALILLISGFLFLFMSVFGSYRVFEFSESVVFCGQTCHVMNPEFVAYNHSPHAKVRCVECHVGGGADHYVKAKLNGVHQLYAITFHTYQKPIPTPVERLRPANETCGACHWSEKFHGDVLRVFNHYGYDEKNSLRQVRMVVKVGGGNPETGKASGIHWHMNLANEITYISTDEHRQNIPWVRMKDASGNVTEYAVKDFTMPPDQVEQSAKRRMDCIDCHNRPAHRYLPPDKAVDDSLTANKLDATLPFIKMKAIEVLTKQYNSTDEAVQNISAVLNDYYQTNYADIYSTKKDSVSNSIAEVQRIYQANFFPEMKTDWTSHNDNIGHFKVQGCFRCHDNQHISKEGKVIRNECSICHTTVDQTQKGVTTAAINGAFVHPVNRGDKGDWQCAACHKSDRPFVHPLNLGDISRFECAECHKGQSLRMKL